MRKFGTVSQLTTAARQRAARALGRLPRISREMTSSEEVVAWQTRLKERRCEVCHATAATAGLDELKKWGGCGGVYYCGREHQREHWTATHKHDCDGSRAQRRAAARVEEVG